MSVVEQEMEVAQEGEVVLGLDSAGLRMTPEEFDAIEEYDENYRYELIDGVLVVSPIPLPQESGPNDVLGYLLQRYKDDHPEGWRLDYTLPHQYVHLRRGRRIADRLIWIGLGRPPRVKSDVAKIAVEFVSGRKRDRKRDYVDKRRDYKKAKIAEYWIIDRFDRTMTVIYYTPSGEKVRVIREHETYESPLLPGLILPLARLLAAADALADLE
jgi:Uma2 family endonuclease